MLGGRTDRNGNGDEKQRGDPSLLQALWCVGDKQPVLALST